VQLPDGRIATYSYDPFGRRIKKQVGTETTLYVYADEGLIGEYTEAGTATKTYGWRPNGIWGTNPLFMAEGSNYYFYHTDHLGTPQSMTDANGDIVWEAMYEAFGKATVDSDSIVTNNSRFAGQYFDVETGLHYNFNRYYDPGTGRYLSVDPLEHSSQNVNLYLYVWNSSVNNIDEKGLFGDGTRNGKKNIFMRETNKGHSDMEGWVYFDYTLEDHGFTNPYIATYRHFKDQSDVLPLLMFSISMCDGDKFKRYMHQGQDYYSHYKKGYHGTWNRKGWIGHLKDWDKPDKDLNAWNESAAWTSAMLRLWEKKCGCGYKAFKNYYSSRNRK